MVLLKKDSCMQIFVFFTGYDAIYHTKYYFQCQQGNARMLKAFMVCMLHQWCACVEELYEQMLP